MSSHSFIQEGRSMGKATKTLRESIHAFLDCYHPLASITAILALPFSFSVLLSQSLAPSSPILQALSSGILLLFRNVGLPVSSPLFSILGLKLSQAIFTRVATLGLALTSLLLAKASVFLVVREFPRRPRRARPLLLLRLYSALLPSQLLSSLALLSAGAVFFSLLFLTRIILDALCVSSPNAIIVLSVSIAVLTSVMLANATAVCSLAIVVAAVESRGGMCLPILRACALIRGREAAAVLLALPTSLGMVATEALFQNRMTKSWPSSSGFGEAFSIAYMHSLLLVLDAVISCMFYRSCKRSANVRSDATDWY